MDYGSSETMKFLLVGINAKYIHSNPAIYSLAAYAGQFSNEEGQSLSENIELAEYTINQNTEDVLIDIYRRKPDVIGFSCYIWNIRTINQVMDDLHKVRPELPIWLGGPEVSYLPRQVVADRPFITGIMIGEGEKTFTELVKQYDGYFNNEGSNGSGRAGGTLSFEDIKGLVTPAYETGVRECLDLNEIPFFYDDLSGFENRIIYYESSRGCPFRCSYCLSSIEKSVRFRDSERVLTELQFFIDHKVPQVKFIDRTFNAHHEHAMRIWTYIKEHDNEVTNFHFEISADLLNEEEIALLNTMRPGLVQLEIGVQSTNVKTIEAINRTMNLDRLKWAVERIEDKGNIHEHLDLIAGLPYEDYNSFHVSFNDVYAMKPNQLQMGFLKVLKGSLMYQEAEKYGIVYGSQAPYEVLCTNWVSFDEMIQLKRIENVVEIFYNSNQFGHTMYFLETAFADAFSMYEKLAEFYEEKGFLTMSPRRLYQYEILLQFTEKYDEKHLELYRELLTLDVYLRENSKTRPAFSQNQDTYKKEQWEIYHREEEERILLPGYENCDAKQMSRMTHMEMFHYPVWKRSVQAIMTCLDRPQPVIFDYQRRNPLTADASLIFPDKS